MLEPKTLKTVPIPNPKDIPGAILDNLLSLVDQRLRNPTDLSLENEIDNITSLLYGLSIEDQESIGVR
jgi:hypothetical protein